MSPAWTGLTFDNDRSRVGSVAPAEFPFALRLFAPLGVSGGGWVTWSAAAERAGVTLDGQISWSSLSSLLPPAWQARPQAGTVDARTLGRCLGALIPESPDEVKVTAVFWDVYAERELLKARFGALEPVPRVPGGDRWQDGSHQFAVLTLRQLASLTYENHLRFPVLAVSEPRSFTLGTPGYADGVYVGCDDRSAERLRAAGLDCVPVSRNQMLPTEA